MKVLVTNPPWPGYGARSDVRWPHKRSDKFIEYAIYLAYVVAVLEKAGIEMDRELGRRRSSCFLRIG